MEGLKIFGWVMLIFAVIPGIFALVLWLFFKIPGVRTWFDRNEETLKKLGGITVGALIVWYFFIGASVGNSWEGEGTINVFPENADAKNYRLEADITTTIHSRKFFLTYKSYEFDSARWPNGGTLEFDSDCKVTDLEPRTTCSADDGTEYFVEVQDKPEYSD